MMGKWLEIACFSTSVFPIRVVFAGFSRKKNRATFSPRVEPTLSVPTPPLAERGCGTITDHPQNLGLDPRLKNGVGGWSVFNIIYRWVDQSDPLANGLTS